MNCPHGIDRTTTECPHCNCQELKTCIRAHESLGVERNERISSLAERLAAARAQITALQEHNNAEVERRRKAERALADAAELAAKMEGAARRHAENYHAMQDACTERDKEIVKLTRRLNEAERNVMTGGLPSWVRRCHGIPNGIFREAARYKAVVLEVRVERLWDITEAGCWAEGIEYIDGMFSAAEICAMAKRIGCCIDDAKPTYALLWNRIYGKRPGLTWADNPWVSVTAWDKMVAI